MTPQRIQRKRSKGWRMPENCVYVGRPTVWGNPFIVGHDGTAAECVKKYAVHVMPYTHHGAHNGMDSFLMSQAFIAAVQHHLRGKNLACWCPLTYSDGSPHPCHADVLLKLANSDPVP